MTPGDVVERLAGLEPVDHAAVALFRRLQGGASAVDLYPDVEQAIQDLDEGIARIKGVANRCRQLQPCPARSAPVGF